MRFYKVQIDDIFLSSDGTSNGIAAKLQIPGADALLLPFTGSTVVAVDGTPNNLIFETGMKGKVIEIRVETYLYKSVWNSIVELINNLAIAGTNANIVGVGDIGNFNVNAKPLMPKPFEATEFENERILEPIFRFITT